ncbi:MAG TPA: hypothetical protein DDY91_02575 [Planctomycetaceae bacterium]|nr:hypothetical protein [Planctomycetaceae bacterium]
MVTMPSRVLLGEAQRDRHRCWRWLRVLLWCLSLLRMSGCAQFGTQRTAQFPPHSGEVLVEAPRATSPVVVNRGTRTSPSQYAQTHQSVTPVRGQTTVPPRGVQYTSPEDIPQETTREVPGEFLPPRTGTPDAPAPTAGPYGSMFQEVPGGYWIVSSREARLAPGAVDSSRDLVYYYRTPHTMQSFPREVFLQTLRTDRPTCFTIHGSYNYWPDVLSESVRSLRWVQQSARGCEVQFVYYSWPADGYAHLVFPLELMAMGRRASRHSLYLANLMSQFPPDQPICLVGHSHGARCSVGALHTLGGGALEDGSRLPAGSPVPRRINAVLLAAAVDHDWLNPGERYGAALRVVDRMLVMQNERDSWLNAYPLKDLMGNRQALGQGGFQESDTVRMNDQMGKITVIDASPFAGRSHDFRSFYSRPELAEAISPFVCFEEPGRPTAPASPNPPTFSRKPQATPVQKVSGKGPPPLMPAQGPARAAPSPPVQRSPQAPTPSRRVLVDPSRSERDLPEYRPGIGSSNRVPAHDSRGKLFSSGPVTGSPPPQGKGPPSSGPGRTTRAAIPESSRPQLTVPEPTGPALDLDR